MVLEAAQVLESNIERLSQGLRDVQCVCPHSHSSSHLQSRSLDRWSRSLSRPQQERRVTFWELEVEPDPEEGPYRGAQDILLGHSWKIVVGSCHPPRGKKLHVPWGGPWPARMLKVGGITHWSLPSRMLKPGWIGRPVKWIHPIGGQNSSPSQGWRTHRNLLGKSMPPFQFQQLEARSSRVKGIPCPLPPDVSPSVFPLDELSYQDMQQQPFLLTVAYAWGLQYWVERLNPPADLDFWPLARSVLELKERVKEHIIFSKQDVIQGLGRITITITIIYFI